MDCHLRNNCTSGPLVTCFLPGVAVPVATWVMVTAVAGMSLLTSVRPVFFYDLALIIWAKGVTISFELTTPTRQKSDSWLASSAPVPQNLGAPFWCCASFSMRPCRSCLNRHQRLAHCEHGEHVGARQSHLVKSIFLYSLWAHGEGGVFAAAMLSAPGNTQVVVFGSLALVV